MLWALYRCKKVVECDHDVVKETSVLTRVWNWKYTDKNCGRSYIKPGNVGLTYEDFVGLHESLGDTYFSVAAETDEETQNEDLWEAFKVFDEDGDGYISAKELQVVLGKLGLVEGNLIDNVQRMILSVDTNHDGRVDFHEFKDMMRTTTVSSSWPHTYVVVVNLLL